MLPGLYVHVAEKSEQSPRKVNDLKSKSIAISVSHLAKILTVHLRAWFATLSIFVLMTIGPSIHSLRKYLESVTDSAGSRSLIATAETIGQRNDPYYAGCKKYQCVECSEQISSLVDPNAPRAFASRCPERRDNFLAHLLERAPRRSSSSTGDQFFQQTRARHL
jgi:hypothetical protein